MLQKEPKRTRSPAHFPTQVSLVVQVRGIINIDFVEAPATGWSTSPAAPVGVYTPNRVRTSQVSPTNAVPDRWSTRSSYRGDSPTLPNVRAIACGSVGLATTCEWTSASAYRAPIKRRGCSALPDEEPRVRSSSLVALGLRLDARKADDYGPRRAPSYYRWSATAMRTINDGSLRSTAWRSAPGRDRPGFAGCGASDGVPGVPVGDRGHKGAAALSTSRSCRGTRSTTRRISPGAAVMLVGLTAASLNGATGRVAQAWTEPRAAAVRPSRLLGVVPGQAVNLGGTGTPQRQQGGEEGLHIRQYPGGSTEGRIAGAPSAWCDRADPAPGVKSRERLSLAG